MNMLPLQCVEDYLQNLRKLGGNCVLTDIHVHATEVIFDEISYEYRGQQIYSKKDTEYPGCVPARIRLSLPKLNSTQETLNKISKLSFSKAFEHSGPKVLEDHMSICGLKRSVLLPVYRADNDFSQQWNFVKKCTSESEKLLLGYCVPSTVEIKDITSHLKEIREHYGLRLLKVHPNLSNIDLGSSEGVDRIEAILESCNQLALPCLFHGGCSPILHEEVGHKHAIMSQMEKIDWSLTRFPVVIAHFGAYGCQVDDPESISFSTLNKILDKHEHVFTDTSGLSYPVLKVALSNVDLSNVVFGSDALYIPMWQATVTMAYTLNELRGEFEESFYKLACVNAEKVLNPALPS